jgi:hypothetical protein
VDRKQEIKRTSSVIRWKTSKVGPLTSHAPPAAIIIPAAVAELKQKLSLAP